MLSNPTIKPLLTPELMAVLAAKVALGHYRSASEAVRAALRLLVEQDRHQACRLGEDKHSVGKYDAR